MSGGSQPAPLHLTGANLPASTLICLEKADLGRIGGREPPPFLDLR